MCIPLLFAISLGPTSPLPAGVQAVADRPNVFQSRKYIDTPVPTFEETESRLPHPIVADHHEWVDLYWKAWQLAFTHLMKPQPASGFVSNFIDPAFNGNTFQWDTCFMVMFAHYASPSFNAIGSLDNFYAKEHADGYICREISRSDGADFVFQGVNNTINPPLFSWVEWENYLLTGDKSRFKDVLPPLVKYYGWLKANRRRENGLYWNTGLGSGEDDLVRNATAYSWADMTAEQAVNAYYIAQIAEQIDETATAKYFEAENRELSKLVGRTMWDSKTGFFYDLTKEEKPTGIKTVDGFWPMLAHIASSGQVAQLVRHLQNTNEFWRHDVVPALAADEKGYREDGQYWNGAVWAPTNFMVVKGLEDYGYLDLAATVTTRYLANMSEVLQSSGTIWENYAPDSSEGHGVRDMVGWSGDGPIALLIENVLGIRGFAATQSVSWRPRLPGENGLRNLTLGATHVSLLAGPIENGKRELTIDADAPISLTVDTGVGKPLELKIQGGTVSKTVKAIGAG